MIGETSSNFFAFYPFITNVSTSDLDKISQQLDATIKPFFSTQQLDQLALDSGFVQRKGKLNGRLFLDLLVFNSESLKQQSLNDLTVVLKHEHDIDITKQSLHERFNASAVTFLKMALQILLRDQLDIEPFMLKLKGINRILIKDSVCFQIDESLLDSYPGSGGSGSKASVRIQFEYDLLTGAVNDLSLNAFNDQDAKNAVTTVELVNKGDLIIRDLAYVGLEALNGLVKRAAFYLCRLNPCVYVFEKQGDGYVKIDFVALYKDMKKHNTSLIEKAVYLGKEAEFNTRLIIHLMPAEQIKERIRKARLNNKKKGRNALSSEYIARAHLSLFITNTDLKVIAPSSVWRLYQLRWQIELAFKIWKSICDIEKVKKVNKNRLECYIYAKLMLIILGWGMIWKISRHLYIHEGKVVSFYKAFKTFVQVKITQVRDICLNDQGDLGEFMRHFYLLSRKKHLLEKKKNKLTSLEVLLSCSSD